VVGIQVKPIFPSGLFSSGSESITRNTVQFDLGLQSGFSAGMLIRHSFNDLVAFEAGINYVKRKYDLGISDGNFTGNSEFRIISYEIPASLLAYIRLGEKFFMNASLGHSLDMFASDVQSYSDYFTHYSSRRNFFQSAVIANLGWEYRTERSGYFYLGASYHRPFGDMYNTHIRYMANGKDEEIKTTLSGNYFTIDIRYFFYEDPKKKNKSTEVDE